MAPLYFPRAFRLPPRRARERGHGHNRKFGYSFLCNHTWVSCFFRVVNLPYLPSTTSSGALTVMMKHFCKIAGLLVTASILPTLWAAGPTTTTPIKYVVVIFQENNSFDHYFGTYPHAQPVNGQVVFHPKDDTPKINGLTEDLLNHKQNSAQPYLITDLLTCNQSNAYKSEQEAYDQGAADEFVEFTEGSGCTVPYEVMGYYDGGIVT